MLIFRFFFRLLFPRQYRAARAEYLEQRRQDNLAALTLQTDNDIRQRGNTRNSSLVRQVAPKPDAAPKSGGLKMDITILKTGRQLFQVDSAVGIALCEAGIAEQIQKPVPAKKNLPEWGIGSTMGKPTIVRNLPNGEISVFDGSPDKAVTAWMHVGWNPVTQQREMMGVTPPEDILLAYKGAYENETAAKESSFAANDRSQRSK